MMRKFLVTATALTVLTMLSVSTIASAGTPSLRLTGRGLEIAPLGISESAAIASLTRAVGAGRISVVAAPGLRNCGVDATASWYSMTAFFDHHRFVGVAFGPGLIPDVATVAGLRVGDTLARARILYPGRLTTSGSQAGTWFAHTPTGRIDGFLNPSTARAPKPSAHIETIEVGVVGCPAMSP
jgi:hypothetical protein